MYRHVETARPTPLLFRVFLFYFAFFFLCAPFYDTLPHPTPSPHPVTWETLSGNSPIMGIFPNLGKCIISYQEVLRSVLKIVNH